MTSALNGAIKLYSAAVLAKRQVPQYYLTIILLFKSLKVTSTGEGRFLICDLNSSGKQMTLANIYATNDDDPNFFTAFFEHLTDFNGEDIIIGGDFNLVLDVEKHKKLRPC